VGPIPGASPQDANLFFSPSTLLFSESTWQSILKSVIATVASTSQFVKSRGIEDVAGRLQGLIDGVIDNSDAVASSIEQHHPEASRDSLDAFGSGNK
jgi:hypothetical protein